MISAATSPAPADVALLRRLALARSELEHGARLVRGRVIASHPRGRATMVVAAVEVEYAGGRTYRRIVLGLVFNDGPGPNVLRLAVHDVAWAINALGRASRLGAGDAEIVDAGDPPLPRAQRVADDGALPELAELLVYRDRDGHPRARVDVTGRPPEIAPLAGVLLRAARLLSPIDRTWLAAELAATEGATPHP